MLDINYDEDTGSHTIDRDRSDPPKKKRKRDRSRNYGDGNEVTVEDLGRKANRKDHFGRTPRENYKYVKWVPPPNDRRVTHKSFLDKDDDTIVIKSQRVPGECILCPKQKFLVRRADSLLHYESVHHKSAVEFRDKRILRCKCSEVRSRGGDLSTRNAHYHCPFCFHPSDYRHQLAKHLYCKHDVSSAECEDLIKVSLTPANEED